jgi:FMNH2-dependent dimethyl sulfone monooxygenase
MRYGFWLPVFGGWLRNLDDESMETSWPYVKHLCQRAEQLGFDLTLIAELNLNDIKGVEAPSLDAWSTAAALAAVTQKLELMVAVRPTFHNPALLAKQAANIDQIASGRLSLNVVSSWWRDEATKYGIPFDEHEQRYARNRDFPTKAHSTTSRRTSSVPNPQPHGTLPAHPRLCSQKMVAPPSTPAVNPTPPKTSSRKNATPT